MGKIADYYTHQQIHQQPYIKKDIYVWKTKEGKEIPVNELDDNHLKNIHKNLSEKLKSIKMRLEITQDEITKRNL